MCACKEEEFPGHICRYNCSTRPLWMEVKQIHTICTFCQFAAKQGVWVNQNVAVQPDGRIKTAGYLIESSEVGFRARKEKVVFECVWGYHHALKLFKALLQMGDLKPMLVPLLDVFEGWRVNTMLGFPFRYLSAIWQISGMNVVTTVVLIFVTNLTNIRFECCYYGPSDICQQSDKYQVWVGVVTTVGSLASFSGQTGLPEAAAAGVGFLLCLQPAGHPLVRAPTHPLNITQLTAPNSRPSATSSWCCLGSSSLGMSDVFKTPD